PLARSITEALSASNLASAMWQWVSTNMSFPGEVNGATAQGLARGQVNGTGVIKKFHGPALEVVGLAQLDPKRLSGVRHEGTQVKRHGLQADKHLAHDGIHLSG